MKSTIKHLVLAVLLSTLIISGCGGTQSQEPSMQAIKIIKSQFQEGGSKASIPQVRGIADFELQTKINNNLKTAVLSLKNQSSGSSLHGDFEVSFYNGIILGLHFKGDSFTPGTARPNAC